MALPGPGNSISASQINVEATRSGTTNAPLAGASANGTPQAGSLVKIYEDSGVNQDKPHRYSEFYSKSYVNRIEVNIALGVPDNSGSFCNTIQTTCWFEQASGNTGIYPQATNGGDVCYTSETGSTKLFGGSGTNYSYGPNQISNPVGFFRILGSTGTVQGTGTCP